MKLSYSLIGNLYKNHLYRNSFWLMAGSFTMAGVGFFYWLIAAHLYTPEQIGLSATFLSVAAIVNLIAMLGFNITLIRYLPTSKTKEQKINTAFTIICLAAFVSGVVYLMGIQIWTSQLAFLISSIPIIALLLVFFPLNILNTTTDSIFTSYREGQWVFVSNLVQSVSKLILLILLPFLGVWGILGSNFVGVALAVVVCLFLIATRYKIHFRPLIDSKVLHIVKKYAFGNYLSGLIGGIPPLLLPIIITNRISPAQTAYFYIPTMIAALLQIIPSMISRAYLAEGSYSNKAGTIRKPLLFSYLIFVPLALVVLLFGRNILNLFGHNYANGGYVFLLLITVAVLVSVVNYFLMTKLQIQHKLNNLILVSFIGSISYLVLAWLLTTMGIEGVGIAAIISQIVSLLSLLILSD